MTQRFLEPAVAWHEGSRERWLFGRYCVMWVDLFIHKTVSRYPTQCHWWLSRVRRTWVNSVYCTAVIMAAFCVSHSHKALRSKHKLHLNWLSKYKIQPVMAKSGVTKTYLPSYLITYKPSLVIIPLYSNRLGHWHSIYIYCFSLISL